MGSVRVKQQEPYFKLKQQDCNANTPPAAKRLSTCHDVRPGNNRSLEE
jgi:hypothetical protein